MSTDLVHPQLRLLRRLDDPGRNFLSVDSSSGFHVHNPGDIIVMAEVYHGKADTTVVKVRPVLLSQQRGGQRPHLQFPWWLIQNRHVQNVVRLGWENHEWVRVDVGDEESNISLFLSKSNSFPLPSMTL